MTRREIGHMLLYQYLHGVRELNKLLKEIISKKEKFEPADRNGLVHYDGTYEKLEKEIRYHMKE